MSRAERRREREFRRAYRKAARVFHNVYNDQARRNASMDVMRYLDCRTKFVKADSGERARYYLDRMTAHVTAETLPYIP